MIDTVSIYHPDGGTLKSECLAALNHVRARACEEWSVTESDNRGPDGRASKPFRLTHNATGLTVCGADRNPTKVTVSFPRLLRPDNSQLLRSEAEFNDAVGKADRIAAQVAELRPRDAHYTRVDITTYVSVAPHSLLPLFEKRKHPGFHKLPKHYPGESLTWGAGGSGARLVFYDKRAEQGSGTDLRTRIELQLHGRRLCNLFRVGEGERLREFTLLHAYQVLRAFLLEFPGVSVGPDYHQDTLLAYAISKGLTAPDGRHLLDWRNAGVRPDTARKNRERVGAAVLGVTGFDFATFLPAEPTADQLLVMT